MRAETTVQPLVLDVSCSCGQEMGACFVYEDEPESMDYGMRFIEHMAENRIQHEIARRMGFIGGDEESYRQAVDRWTPCGVPTPASEAEEARVRAEIEAEGAEAFDAAHTIVPTTYPALQCPHGCGWVWRGWHICDARGHKVVTLE